MPIYEFTCSKCGKPTEVLQRFGERPPPCPHCGSKRMARNVSRTSFQLKGGGWYADLYATPRPGDKKAEGSEASKGAEEKPVAAPKVDAAGGAPAAPAPAKAPPATAAPAKAEAAPRAASNSPRRRPTAPRKRR